MGFYPHISWGLRDEDIGISNSRFIFQYLQALFGENFLIMSTFFLKRHCSAVALLLFGFSVAAIAQSNSSFPNAITLKFPNSPPPGTQVLDGTFQSFSIEYAYMADFGGNLRYHHTFHPPKTTKISNPHSATQISSPTASLKTSSPSPAPTATSALAAVPATSQSTIQTRPQA